MPSEAYKKILAPPPRFMEEPSKGKGHPQSLIILTSSMDRFKASCFQNYDNKLNKAWVRSHPEVTVVISNSLSFISHRAIHPYRVGRDNKYLRRLDFLIRLIQCANKALVESISVT